VVVEVGLTVLLPAAGKPEATPDMEQPEALLTDHVRVDESPLSMDDGEALKLLTVQPVPLTVTVTESDFMFAGDPV